jgi:hypothetical protein
MLTIRCPQCQRLLNLPEDLRGSPVQCPSCQNCFRAPGDTAPLRPPDTARAEPGFKAGQEDRDQTAEEDAGTPYRVRRQVTAVASWLRRGVTLDWITLLLCCPWSLSLGGPAGPGDGVVFFFAAHLFLFPVGVLILVGTGFLQQRRYYGLSITAGILALLLGIKNGLQALALFFGLLESHRIDGCLMLMVMLMLGLSLTAAVSLCVGGIKTFIVLPDDEVHRDFR